MKLQTVHHLTPTLRQKRLEVSKKLLARFVVGADNNILFSDEKMFTVEESDNSQNDHILAPSSKDIRDENKFIDRVQKPQHLMVWAGVSASCRTNLIFLPQGVKINSEIYKGWFWSQESKVRARSYSIMKNGSSNRILLLLTPPMQPNRGYVQKILSIFRRKSGHLQVQILTHSTILYGGYCRQGLV